MTPADEGDVLRLIKFTRLLALISVFVPMCCSAYVFVIPAVVFDVRTGVTNKSPVVYALTLNVNVVSSGFQLPGPDAEEKSSTDCPSIPN